MATTRSAGGRSAIRALVAALALAGTACDGSGGGSSGGGGAPSPSSSSVSLAWTAAAGPVAGYAVYVQRDGGSYRREQDVSSAAVTLEGEPGETARIAVRAFTRSGLMGPTSAPSAVLSFPGAEPAAQAASAAPTASARTLALPAPDAGAEADAADSAEPEPDTEESRDPTPADLAAGLVWRADGAVRVTDAALETLLLLSAPAGAVLVGADDFDGDGAPELLWAEGEVLSTTPLVGPETGERVGFGLLEPGERVAGVGDLDGDGLADLVLVADDGAVRSWLTASGVASEPLGSARGAALVGVADFDGDGVDDLAWRGPDGAWTLWLMDGDRVHASLELALSAELEPAAAGDFDGDGEAELVLRDAAGGLHVAEPLDETLQAAGAAAGAWRPVGAADLDVDGRDELVLAGDAALLVALLPGEHELSLDPASPWQLAALLP